MPSSCRGKHAAEALIHCGLSLLAATASLLSAVVPAHATDKKPNILVIRGDDIGIHNKKANFRGHLQHENGRSEASTLPKFGASLP